MWYLPDATEIGSADWFLTIDFVVLRTVGTGAEYVAFPFFPGPFSLRFPAMLLMQEDEV